MLKYPDSPGFLIDGFPREASQGVQFEEEVRRCLCYASHQERINPLLLTPNVISYRVRQRIFSVQTEITFFRLSIKCGDRVFSTQSGSRT